MKKTTALRVGSSKLNRVCVTFFRFFFSLGVKWIQNLYGFTKRKKDIVWHVTWCLYFSISWRESSQEVHFREDARILVGLLRTRRCLRTKHILTANYVEQVVGVATNFVLHPRIDMHVIRTHVLPQVSFLPQ